MKIRYHIYKARMNSGELKLLTSNSFSKNKIPTDGFKKKKKAKKFLKKLIEERQGDGFERNWYRYVILETYHSYHAFYLQKENKKLKKVDGFPRYLAELLYVYGIYTLNDISRLSWKNISSFFEADVLEDIWSQTRKYHISIRK